MICNFEQMLIANNIHKTYNGLEVLKGINLEVKEKEIVSIIGASGAGKSTLLHILGALDQPDKGQVKLNQKEFAGMTPNQIAGFRNKEIGFVFQFHNLLPEFTALENVCIPGYISGSNRKNVELKAYETLKLLGLDKRGGHKPSELSGGEQQRVAVARALINDPSVIFADEPSGNLDSKNADDLHELFFKLRETMGQTFVIVTHNPSLAEMADRKLEIVDGIIKNQNSASL